MYVVNKAAIYLNFILTVICYSFISSPSHAQTDQTDTTKESSKQLKPIKVNARYWTEKQSEIPVSATVIKEQELDGTDINILTTKTSNVAIESSSVQRRVSIRGSRGVDNGLQDPVGYFVDDVALPLGGNQLPPLFNLESLEIVKGPQGALYGRNTEAGAVKIKTKDPSWTPVNWGALSTGNIDGADGNASTHVVTAGVSNTLLRNKLAGSIAFRLEDTEGPYLNEPDGDRSGGEVDRNSFSAGLTYLISDKTDITLKSLLDNNDTGRNRFRYSDGINETDRFTTNTDSNGTEDTSNQIHSLKINHTFNEVELTSITGLTDYQREFKIDFDATTAPLPNTLLDLKNKAVSQELRLSFDTIDSKLKWLTGLYIYDEESDIDFSISPLFMTNQRVTQIDQEGQALFGQIDYHLASEWILSLGGRYEKIEQNGTQALTNALGTTQYDADIDQSEFLPKASLSFKPNINNTIYISYAEGYLPGGYNYNSAGDESSFTFDAEYSQSSELAWKNTSFKNRLYSSITLFKVTTKDKQIVDTLPGFVQSVSNAGETETYGVELAMDYRITPALSSFINIGLQRSEATSYTINSFGSSQDLSGNELPYAPESTYSIGFSYQQKKGLVGSASLRGSSKYYFNSENTLEQSSFVLFDADIGYRFQELTLSVWGKNLTNEELISRAVSTPSGTVVEDGQARTVGIRLSKSL